VVRVRVWRWFAAVAVWLLAVAVVAGVAWFAIDSAGREVSGGDDVVSLVSAAQPSPAVATAPRGAVPSPLPSALPSPLPSATALGAARPGTQTRAGTRAVTPARTPAGTPSVPGPGGGRTSTYSSAGGDLVVRCVDDEVMGWVMRPADGWRAEAVPAEGGELRVLFVGGEGGVLGVDVACRNGQASFSPTSKPART
jgi:hypothetical protein